MKKKTVEKIIRKWFESKYGENNIEFTFRYWDKYEYMGITNCLAVIEFRIKSQRIDKGGIFALEVNSIKSIKAVITGNMDILKWEL